MDERDELLATLYSEVYSSTAVSATGSGAARYMHRTLERAFGPRASFPRVLELGANCGEHVPFVRHQFDEYVVTDLREPVLPAELAGNPKVRTAICDAGQIAFPSQSFDRVLATCLMHHVNDPLQVAREARRVTRTGGMVTLLVPTDPGTAYRAAQAVTSGRTARRRGLGARWSLMHAVDHRNHFRSIRAQLRHVFQDDSTSVTWLPLHFPSVELNLLTVWQIEVGRHDQG
jgi:SAM-dependent methyltransferase